MYRVWVVADSSERGGGRRRDGRREKERGEGEVHTMMSLSKFLLLAS